MACLSPGPLPFQLHPAPAVCDFNDEEEITVEYFQEEWPPDRLWLHFERRFLGCSYFAVIIYDPSQDKFDMDIHV